MTQIFFITQYYLLSYLLNVNLPLIKTPTFLNAFICVILLRRLLGTFVPEREFCVIAESVVQELKDAHLRVKGGGGGRRRTSEEREQDAANPEELNLRSNSSRVQLDHNGFVVPKKLFNPCLESRECQELHREIKWNAKA